jgi:hypothetical protein
MFILTDRSTSEQILNQVQHDSGLQLLPLPAGEGWREGESFFRRHASSGGHRPTAAHPPKVPPLHFVPVGNSGRALNRLDSFD